MKIAMITPGRLPVPAVSGGAVEVLTEVLLDGNEKAKNHQIDVYTIWNEKLANVHYQYTNIIRVDISNFTRIKNKIGNELYRLFKIKKWRTSYSRTVVKLLKNKTYDLVVVQNNLIAYRDIYEKTKNRNNLVYVIHNNVNDGDENNRVIAELMAKTAKKILAVSHYTKHNFLEVAKTENIEVLYNCVDVAQYAKGISSHERLEIRQEYHIEKDDFVFMYSGRVDIYKGVLELVQAFKRLKDINVKLLIVGKSWFDESQTLDAYTQKLIDVVKQIKDRVIFTGFVSPDNMPQMYHISDCLVIPSLWEEPFGVVALEGMAAKLPIIATKSGGLMEVVDETCAYIVNKNEDVVHGLEMAMKNILADKKKANDMGNNGYQRLIETEAFDRENYYRIFCEKIGI